MQTGGQVMRNFAGAFEHQFKATTAPSGMDAGKAIAVLVERGETSTPERFTPTRSDSVVSASKAGKPAGPLG